MTISTFRRSTCSMCRHSPKTACAASRRGVSPAKLAVRRRTPAQNAGRASRSSDVQHASHLVFLVHHLAIQEHLHGAQ